MEEIRPGRRIFVRRVSISNFESSSANGNSNNNQQQLQVIFCHGTCASQEQYSALLQALDENITTRGGAAPPQLKLTCLLWDQVGCGQSPPVAATEGRKAYNNEAIQADLEVLLQKYASKTSTIPSFIVGHSYAASIFLPLLNRQPELLPNLKGCLLFGTGLRSAHLPLADGGHPIMKLPVPLLRCLQGQLTEAFLQMAVHPKHTDVLEAARVDSNRNNTRVAKYYHTQHHWADASELQRLVENHNTAAAAAIKILLVHGAVDGVIPLECAQDLHNMLLQQSSNDISELVVIDEASHLVMIEQPAQVAVYVLPFLLKCLK